jgi:hypothetical protein
VGRPPRGRFWFLGVGGARVVCMRDTGLFILKEILTQFKIYVLLVNSFG